MPIIIEENISIEALETILEVEKRFLNDQIKHLSSCDTRTVTDVEMTMYHLYRVYGTVEDLIAMAKKERSLFRRFRMRFTKKK